MRYLAFILIILSVFSPLLFGQSDSLNALGELGGFRSIQDILCERNIAYIGDGNSLYLVDITDSTSPSIRSECELSATDYTTALEVASDYAYVIYGEKLGAVNVSNPDSIFLENEFELPNYGWDVEKKDSLLFVSTSDGLVSVTLPTPTTFTQIDFYTTAGQNKALEVRGNYAYLGVDRRGFYVLDISDPTSLTPISTVDTPGWCLDVKVQGDYAFVADGSIPGTDDYSVRVINISEPTSISEEGHYITSGNAYSTLPYGDYLFIADGSEGIILADISTPSSPSLLYQDSTLGEVKDIFIKNELIYVVSASSLSILSSSITEYVSSGTKQQSNSNFLCSPNPTSSKFDVNLSLNSGSQVTLSISDLEGNLVDKQKVGFLSTGKHSVSWCPDLEHSGVYLITGKTKDKIFRGKILIYK